MPQYISETIPYAVQIMALLSAHPNEYLLATEIARALGEPPHRVDYVRIKLNRAFKVGWLTRRRIFLEIPYGSYTRIKKGWEWAITNKGLGYLDWLKEDAQRESEEELAKEESRRRALLRAKPRPKLKYETIEVTPEELEEMIEEAPEELEAPPEYPALPPSEEEEEEEELEAPPEYPALPPPEQK